MKQSKLSFGKGLKQPTKSKTTTTDKQEKKAVDPMQFFSKKVEQTPGLVKGVKKSKYFHDSEIDSILLDKAEELESPLLDITLVSDENVPVEAKDETPKVENDSKISQDSTKEEGKKKFNFYAHKAKLSQMPKAHGSKEIPVGEENCLGGLAFVFTGELSSLTRDEAVDLVKRYGGYI